MIAAADAPALLDEFAKERVRVVGAEGFHIDGEEVTPVVEAILDLSTIEDRERSVREARQFIDLVAAPGLFVQFGVRGEVR